jgi:hypothetical protein
MAQIGPISADERERYLTPWRHGSLDEVGARRPRALITSPPPARPTERVLESLEGLVEAIEGPEAAVAIIEDGKSVEHLLPAWRLTSLGLREGDSFWFDVVEVDGQPTGRLRVYEPTKVPARPERYLAPDDIDALERPW